MNDKREAVRPRPEVINSINRRVFLRLPVGLSPPEPFVYTAHSET